MIATFAQFHASYTWKKLLFMTSVAFLVRALPFYFYIQHKERYHQADSMDYHVCALGLQRGVGMRRPDNAWPIFWRTPGYPAYLALFYKLCKEKKLQFYEVTFSHKAALWVQIVCSSFAPVLIFFLVLSLISVIPLAWLVAWIFVFHPGFILASGYLLTEALAVLFFFLFLIFLYKKYVMIGQGVVYEKQPLSYSVISAFFLAVYTWMRPMGQFVAFVTLLLYMLLATSWKRKLKHIVLFFFIFWGLLSPWIIRNYHHTGKIFFWPGSGSYLVSFNVPKILRRITGASFEDCHKRMMMQVSKDIFQEYQYVQKNEPNHFVCQELVCAKIAWPWIIQYPWYFIEDWFKEVCKTTFDLYGSQLVNFTRDTYMFDPAEEFLFEKYADCLYKQPMHWFMRLLCIVEFLCFCFIWIGILAGFVTFFIHFLYKRFQGTLQQRALFFVWLKSGIMIGAVLGMTGGFGYARLRMPIEPLLVLLSLTFWWYLWQKIIYKEQLWSFCMHPGEKNIYMKKQKESEKE